jgi:hypothetical protein
MQTRRCPHCLIPILASEGKDHPCPSCGGDLLARTGTQQPGTARPGRLRGLLQTGMFVIGLLSLMTALAIAWSVPTDPPAEPPTEALQTLVQEKTQAEAQAREARAAAEQAQALVQAAEEKHQAAETRLQETNQQLQEQQTRTEQALAAAQAQAKAAEERAARSESALTEGTRPLHTTPVQTPAELAIKRALAEMRAREGEPVAADPLKPAFVPFAVTPTLEKDAEGRSVWVVRINHPTGEYVQPPLDNQAVVKLVGQLRTLKVSAIKGGAQLDASELQADRIEFHGDIHGESRVSLRAVHGRVSIPAVRDESQVDIRAEGGRVTIGKVDGDARVTVLAREADFPGTIQGSKTRVMVTLTNKGKLSFEKLLESSRLTWVKNHPADSDPRITEGSVKTGAEFRRLD